MKNVGGDRMERTVVPGEFYRHFKDKLYQIVAVARHSETGERMVVYQALYGDYQVYVRPYEMFVSPVDREKYPYASQTWRFEKVVLGASMPTSQTAAEPGTDSGQASRQPEEAAGTDGFQEPQEPQEPNPTLLEFLDSRSFEVRMECLRKLKKTGTRQDMESICMALDVWPPDGTIAEQVSAIERYLKLQEHFDGGHLR